MEVANNHLSAQIQSQIRTQLQNQEISLKASRNPYNQMRPSPSSSLSSAAAQFQNAPLPKIQSTVSLSKQQFGKQLPPLQPTQQQHHQKQQFHPISLKTPPSTSNGNSNNSGSGGSNSGSYKRPRQIFSIEQEEELAVFVRDTSNYYNGMSSKDVRTLAFVYGVCNQVDLPLGWRESYQASFDWCLGFIKRNKLTPMMITSHCRTSSASAANNFPAAPVTDNNPSPLKINMDNTKPANNVEPVASEAC